MADMHGGVRAAVLVRGGKIVRYNSAAADTAFTREGLAGAAGCRRGSPAERTWSHAGLQPDFSTQGAVEKESEIRNKKWGKKE